MKITAAFMVRIALILGLLAAGFALGFPVGQQRGFDSGSEWGIVQADIAAREAGSSLIISMEEGPVRVVVRQPRGLYKRAQQQAELRDGRRTAVRTAATAVPVRSEAAQ